VDAPSGVAVTRATPRLRDGLAWCLGLFFAGRIWLSVIGVVTTGWFPEPVAFGPGGGPAEPIIASAGLHNAWDGTLRWDAAWYLWIAEEGYGEGGARAAFPPAFPLATRALAWSTGAPPLAAALVVSNLACFGALLVLHALTRLDASEVTARRTTALLAAFPSAFFLWAPYPESSFLFLALLAFWFARTRRWPLAGLAGAAAALTKALGIAVAPALLVESRRGGDRRRALLAAGLVLAGVAAFPLFWALRGSPLEPFEAQALWRRNPTFPLFSLGRGIALGLEGLATWRGRYWTVDMVLSLVVVGALALGWRWLRPSYLVYGAICLLIPLTFAVPARPLLSMPRFALVIFPAFWVLAHQLRGRAYVGWLAVSGAAWSVLAMLFVNWRYVF
jgi:hypothetical protein